MNKKIIATAALTGILVSGMVLHPIQKAAAASEAEYSKNENVYVRLDSEGDVTGTYVVNAFTVKEAGEITDYGDYESIHNLTNLDVIEEDKDEYTFYAEKGKFYYQGNMGGTQLPWNFEMRYELDGKRVTAEELAGADGDLEIHMLIRENTATDNPDFYPAYLLQVSFTLDNDLCEDIVAKGASMADAGANQQVTFTVMPETKQNAGSGETNTQDEEETGEVQDEQPADTEDGQPADTENAEVSDEQSADTEQEESSDEGDTAKEVELVISASVTDFEMGDISINGAAMTDFPVSFVSEDNQQMGQTMFIMSMEGITIPEEEVVETVVEDNRSFFEKLTDKILNHKED